MVKRYIKITLNHSLFKEFEIKPIEGYSEHINELTGEKFPYCCETHKKIYNDLKELCNEPVYAHLPDKIIRQFTYTEFHIIKQIEIDDWYKDITDYIEWNYFSFGNLAYGQRIYTLLIKELIEHHLEGIAKEKRDKLLDNIRRYFNADIKASEEPDLDIIYSTYENWLNLFPFELTNYFGNLKQYFESGLPIINTKEERNIYINISHVKFHSKTSLVEVLVNLTNDLLTKISGVMLYEKGNIGNTEKIQWDLAISSRKLKLKQGYIDKSINEEYRYIQIIEDWFKDEKNFFNEITPLLKSLTLPRPEPKNKKLSIKQIALIHAYEGNQITRKNAAAIAEQYGFNAPNSGEGLFQDYNYYSITQNRKGKPHPCTSRKFKNKIELLESVTEHINDEAKQRALLEISILKKLFENEDE
jgi:hypothetical protein